jgi:tRNA(Leu) C34 or U34 (ribose-2'-O)-methylase TrmL
VDIIVNAGAVAYGITLVVATFVRHPLTEAMRIDALFIPQANERTRPLNLLMGVAIAGYGAWSLLSR